MKSPFPGMDPFLERRLGDFHTRFVTYLSDEINPSLPESLSARVEERVVVEDGESDTPPQFYRPDAHVFERSESEDDGGGVALAQPVTEPVVLPETLEDAMTQRSLVIVDAGGGGRVYSAIELLSPFNKQPGPGQRIYWRKHDAYVDAAVNLLELDLQLTGEATTIAARRGIPPQHATTYHASLLIFAAVNGWSCIRFHCVSRCPGWRCPCVGRTRRSCSICRRCST